MAGDQDRESAPLPNLRSGSSPPGARCEVCVGWLELQGFPECFCPIYFGSAKGPLCFVFGSRHCSSGLTTGASSPCTYWAPFGLTPRAQPSQLRQWGHSLVLHITNRDAKPDSPWPSLLFCPAFLQCCRAQMIPKGPFWRQGSFKCL